MTKEYSKWFEHDGRGFPRRVFDAFPDSEGWKVVERVMKGHGLKYTPAEMARGDCDSDHPGWVWKRSGLFGLGRRWVSSDPIYKRIVRFRFIREIDTAKTSKQVEVLKAIASDPSKPLVGAE